MDVPLEGGDVATMLRDQLSRDLGGDVDHSFREAVDFLSENSVDVWHTDSSFGGIVTRLEVGADNTRADELCRSLCDGHGHCVQLNGRSSPLDRFFGSFGPSEVIRGIFSKALIMFAVDSPEKRLLVVEDDDVQRHSIMELLKLPGYCVVGVSSGEEALQYINKKIDLVVIDFNMGVLNGGDVLKSWLQSKPVTQFIFLTAEDREETALTMIKSGATDYLIKPVNPDVLLTKIYEALHFVW